MRIEKYKVMSNDKEALALYLQMVEATSDGTKTIIENGDWYELVDTPPEAPKTDEEIVSEIRARRETECFRIINRGTLWYDTLTEEQKAELREWYLAWLDAPQTGIIPQKPEWLEEK